MVRRLAFQAGNTGPIPVGAIICGCSLDGKAIDFLDSCRMAFYERKGDNILNSHFIGAITE